MKLLVVGHSHLDAVRASAVRHAGLWAARGLALRFVQLREPRLHSLDPTLDADDMGDALRAELARQAEGCDATLLMVGGNAHNGLGLFEHPQPFDFVAEDEPDTAPEPGRTLIPEPLLAAHLAAWDPFARPARQRARLLALVPRPLGQTDSPPPLADPQRAWASLSEAHRQSPRARQGLAPARLRLKVWRLHGRLLQQDCRRLGLPLLPAPPAALGADGGLAPACQGDDAIHANAEYGRLVLEQALA